MSTSNPRNMALGMAASQLARRCAFKRVSTRTPFKSASVNLPANCIFVAMRMDEVRPVSLVEKLYTQGKQSSSAGRLRVMNAPSGQLPGFKLPLPGNRACASGEPNAAASGQTIREIRAPSTPSSRPQASTPAGNRRPGFASSIRTSTRRVGWSSGDLCCSQKFGGEGLTQ